MLSQNERKRIIAKHIGKQIYLIKDRTPCIRYRKQENRKLLKNS